MNVFFKGVFGVFCLSWPLMVLSAHCPELIVEARTVTQQEAAAEMSVQWPRVTSHDSSCPVTKINQTIQDYVKTVRQDYRAQVQASSREGVNQLRVHYELLNNTKGVLSVLFHSEVVIAGQAHPTQSLYSVTFSLARGTVLTLADMGIDQPGLQFIAQDAYQALFQRFTAEDQLSHAQVSWLTRGTAPLQANYAIWNLTPAGLQITFPRYQVASRQYGAPTVVMAYDRLTAQTDFHYPKEER